MKHWRELKKLYSYILVGMVLLFPTFFSVAETIDELNLKINQKNVDITNLQNEINQFQSQLDQIGKQKSSLNNSIKELDLTKKKLVANINITQKKIDKTNLKILELSSQIFDKENSISNDNRAINMYIKKTSEFEDVSMVEVILSGQDFTSAWNDIDNMVTIREELKNTINELKEVKGQLEDTRSQTLSAKKELLSLKSSLADQKKIVDQNTAEKKRLLKETKNNESNYQKLLADRLAKKVAFEAEVRNYESKIKYILDPSKLPSANVLSWPLENIYITQFFGKTEAGKRLYANGTHNGIDFRASVGTPVISMADGVIAGTGDTDLTCYKASFGRFVFIKYNNGLASTYGHLSLIKVHLGQKVSKGDIVGYSGNTGYSTGPHLHVSVYAADSVNMQSRPSVACGGRTYTMPIAPVNGYLDPMYYLPAYNK